ncbi:hypothetical protein ACVWZL_009105 [Bradyrhizobium sp. GM2.4]
MLNLQSRLEPLVFLSPLLWACGQRDCVVQGQRHVHCVTAQAFPADCSAEALSGEIEPIGIVDEAIEHVVGIGGISNEQMPLVHGELAGNDGRAMTVAIFEDFKEVVTGAGIERLEPPIIEDQQIDTAEAAQ